MAIEKTKLFERAQKRWPSIIRVIPVDGVPCFESNPCLTEVYRTIERSCEHVGEWTNEDEWTCLANWSFHQAFCALAERCGERDLHREEVTFEMFDERMRFNLSDARWTEERLEYEKSPSRFH